jgi:ribonuclease P protein component
MGQAGAALEPAAAQNLTPGLCGHSFHKTVLAAALTFFGLIGSLWHNQYLSTEVRAPESPPLDPRPKTLYPINMISRSHRFHGRKSLSYVYAHGRTARGPLFAIKAAPNTKKSGYRVAVVVSRKVNKSAVVRNRIRRRLYAAVRAQEKDLNHPHDIVITVFSDGILKEPAKSLEHQLKRQLSGAGVLSTTEGA